MRFFSLKILSLLLLASACAGTLQASYDNDMSEECCNNRCWECRCEPLYECSWGLQFAAGVRPILWHQRDDFFSVNCLSTTTLNDLGQMPKFSSLYHVPFQVGGQLSYATSCNTNLFVEFNYASARTKDQTIALGTSGLTLSVSRYKLYDGYFGARYYFNRWLCNRVSFFFGGKLGFVHHKSMQASSSALSNGVLCYPLYEASTYNFFSRNTVFAGGGHLGFDFCLTGDLSFVITAEVVANCGPKAAGALGVCSYDALILSDATNLLVPAIRSELAFPVTFGLKYNF